MGSGQPHGAAVKKHGIRFNRLTTETGGDGCGHKRSPYAPGKERRSTCIYDEEADCELSSHGRR